MPIVRILSGSASFSAMDYNAQRFKNGEGEFLFQRNFPALFKAREFNLACFKQYLRLWSARNSRIKNSQFHVTISAKGKTLSKQQLQDIGERWIKLMGYSNNPYCIFYHHNTRNNHIHIVTSRIDPDGKKISDKFEKTRAVQVLDAIVGHDRVREGRIAVADYLRFSCSNKNQFFSILESNGFDVRHSKGNENFYQLYRHGQFICSLQDDLIEWANARYSVDSLIEERKKQIRALLIKYANKSHSFYAMNELLRKHHGMSLVLYGGKDGKAFYGYSVIDYRNRRVYKGSEFANIAFLTKIHQKQPPSIDEATFFIRSLLENNPNLTIKELNKLSIDKAGFYVNKEGLLVTGVDSILGNLSDDLFSRLRYNGIIEYCNDKFHPITEGERNWIAAHYHISSDDLLSYAADNREYRAADNRYYEDVFASLMQSEDFIEAVGESGYSYSRHNGEYIFFDSDRSTIFSTEVLSPDLSTDVYDSLNYADSPYSNPNMEDNSLFEDFATAIKDTVGVLSVADTHIAAGSGSQVNKKKRKKKRTL